MAVGPPDYASATEGMDFHVYVIPTESNSHTSLAATVSQEHPVTLAADEAPGAQLPRNQVHRPEADFTDLGGDPEKGHMYF